jgi:hypothetical protein
MKRILAITLLLTSTAFADDTVYITPIIPDEATKAEALKLGFILNGYSMRRGSIDLSGPVKCLLLQPSTDSIQKRREACDVGSRK